MDSSDRPAIVARGLSKVYRIWERPSSRLVAPALEAVASWVPSSNGAGALRRYAAKLYRDFCALDDVSFELRRGEAIGIVGRNGSGKSTLLQIVAGTLQPSMGEVSSHGRIAALLELGSGFNHDFTGRENVYLNAAVLGLSRTETDARFDRIAAFADIGDFLDQPVKIYSSGMVMRLAFAVAIHVDPEVLIVDEALAVGDARFQLKCARAIDAILARGVGLLFVSHDLSMVKRLCSRAILLEQGRMLYTGRPNDVVNLYSKLVAEGGSAESIAADIDAIRQREDRPPTPAPAGVTRGAATAALGAGGASVSEPSAAHAAELARLQQRVRALESTLATADADSDWKRRVELLLRHEEATVSTPVTEYSYGGELGRIAEFRVLDAGGLPRTWFAPAEEFEVQFEVEALSDITDPILALTIKDVKGQDVYGTNSLFSRQPAPALASGDRRLVRFRLVANLMPGDYFISLGFTQFVGDELVVIHRRYDAIKLSIHGHDRCFGIANCYARISVEPV